MKRHTLLASLLAGSLAVGSAVAFSPHTFAKDKETKTEERKWTDAERARDALDHLKKAHEHLVVLSHDKANTHVAAARKAVDEAIDHVDKLIADIDKPAKK